MPRAFGIIAATFVVLCATKGDLAKAAPSEPADFAWTTCTDYSNDFEEIVSAFKGNGWTLLTDREDPAFGEQLAIAKIGLTVRGTPSSAQWLSAYELRVRSAQAELRKTKQEFYRSALMQGTFSGSRELVFITWVRERDQVVSLRCVYAGQTANNPLATNVLSKAKEQIGQRDLLIYYEQVSGDSSVADAFGLDVSVTQINRQDAERMFGHALPADLGLSTQLIVRLGSK